MGWASGSSLFRDVWVAVRPHIAKVKRVHVCCDLMRAFEQRDCDTLRDAFRKDWPEVVIAYDTLHPEYREQTNG